MTTLKVGIASLDQYKERTMAIVRGEYKVGPDEPKVWFSSIESFAKILSESNRELLKIIAETEPQSLNELAETTGRAISNLSRTLKTMERHGLVRFEKGEGRSLAPRTPYTDVVLNLPLQDRPKTVPRAFEFKREGDPGSIGYLAEPDAGSYDAGPPSAPDSKTKDSKTKTRQTARRDPARRSRRRP